MSLTLSSAVPVATPAQVLARPDAVVIDLRSPGEFAEDHLPGALNVPLFDDVERALIGTLYQRTSPDAAFDEGRRRVLERITSLTAEVARAAGWEAPAEDLGARVEQMTREGIERLDAALAPADVEQLPERPVVLHCWRGGLRSRAVIAFLRALGLERAVGLQGGYKGYRRHVMAGLAAWQGPPCVVLRGLTGVGKTLVLRELERQRPGWTLDLEGLAGHRSSILGMVGLEPCTQKTFDTRLYARLQEGFPAGVCVVEGESRKVGDAILPERVWAALDAGTNVLLEAGTRRRTDVLLADYLATEENRAPLAAQLPFIEERLGKKLWRGVLTGLLEARRERELVKELLEHYYDPLYRHSEKGRDYARKLPADDPAACARGVIDWIESGGVPRA